MKRGALIMGLALAGAGYGGPTGPAPMEKRVGVQYQLFLDRAAVQPQNPRTAVNLLLDLEQWGETWTEVYALARDYNMNFHRGGVLEARTGERPCRLRIGVVFEGDRWMPGGVGLYDVDFDWDAEGRVRGTFTGEFRGQRVEGMVTGFRYEPQPDADRPVVDEHPRLWFTRSQLPALRAKMDTPLGEELRRRAEAGGPALSALLYQLTGDRSWADAALRAAEQIWSRRPWGDPFVPLRPQWGMLENLAVHYDLCHDVLPGDWRVKFRSWLFDRAFVAFFAPEIHRGVNWHVVSNHSASVYAGLLMCALAAWDERAECPEPVMPWLESAVPLAEDYEPAAGVPVVKLRPGVSPSKWIRTEPIHTLPPYDPCETMLGLEKLRPEPGVPVRLDHLQVSFRPVLPEEEDTQNGGLRVGPWLMADADARLHPPFAIAAFTVLEVEEGGRYVVRNPSSRANRNQLALNGYPLVDGQVVELQPGRYPLMVWVQWRMRWGNVAPVLARASDEDVAAWQRARTEWEQIAAIRRRRFEHRRRAWELSGGRDPAIREVFRLARMAGVLHCRDAVGRGGFQAEVGIYSLDAMPGFAKAWTMFRNVMGYDLSPGGEYPAVIPRKLIGGPQDINGSTKIPLEFFAALYPVIREEWKPEILGAWRKAAVAEARKPLPGAILEGAPVPSFIHYPMDVEDAPLGARLPSHWEAPDMGYYALRSGWDERAIIAQVFAKQQHIRGWSGSNAGTYRLYGFGMPWACGPTDRVRRRQEENVVWFPDADHDHGARGRVIHADVGPGKLIVSLDLSEVYENEGRYRLSSYGHQRYPAHVTQEGGREEPPPSGIEALRCIAFDFTGLSGVPCLWAVVDRFRGDGGQRRLWLFQPPIHPPAGQRNSLRVADVVQPAPRGFVIRRPDTAATVRGLFVLPESPALQTEPLTYRYTKTWGQQRGQVIEVRVNALQVPGTGDFFFVGTLGEGDHPEIRIEGTGLDATVRVGRRTIRFSGDRLVLGD